MIEVVIAICAIICAAAFMFGYVCGLEDLSKIANWGIGFDDGVKAAMELMEEKGDEEISEVERENDTYKDILQELEWYRAGLIQTMQPEYVDALIAHLRELIGEKEDEEE